MRRIDNDPARREVTVRMKRTEYDRLPERAREMLHFFAGAGIPVEGFPNPLAAPIEFTLPEYRVQRIEQMIEEEGR